MNIFIDTEFNSYKGALISLALVSSDGREFYCSVGCDNPDPWVAEHVMPVIGIPAFSIDWIQTELEDYLSQFESVHLIADWPEDIQHFCETLITGPGTRINTPPLTMEIRRDLDAVSAIPHNALEDAKAIRKRWMQITYLGAATPQGQEVAKAGES